MKRALLLSICAALIASPLVSANAFAQSNDEGRRLVQAGQAAFQVGDYTRAAQLLWDATMADTAVRDDAQLQIMRARAVMQTGRPENAVRIFDRIGGSAEAYADAMYWRGEALMMMTEPGEAADSFREALRFVPDHQLAQRRLSGMPAGLTAPVAVEAPLIDAAPVEVIGAEPMRPASATPAPAAPVSAVPLSVEPAPQAPAEIPPVEAQPVQPAQPAPSGGGAPTSLRPSTPEAPDMQETPEASAPAAAPPVQPGDLARGRAAFAEENWSDAAAYLWRASQEDPAVRNDSEVQLMRAGAVMRSGRPETAIVVLDEIAATASDARAAQALYLRGEAQEMLGREDAAIASWREAETLQPGATQAGARLAALAPAPVQAAAAAPEPAAPVQAASTESPAGFTQIAAVTPAPSQAAQPEADPLASGSTVDPEKRAASARELAAERREAGDRAGEARALSDVYLTQRASEQEIERYAELTEGAVSAEPGRDSEIAQLAGLAGFEPHTRLSVALYRSVEATGELSGRNLAVLQANLATSLLAGGDADGAVDAADAALEADDTYANAWAVRSLAKQEQGELGEALEDAKQAYDRGVTAPPVLALLQAAGFAVNAPGAPARTAAGPSEDGAPLRGPAE